MLIDYENQYYNPLCERYNKMIANNFELAKQVAEWKKKVANQWEQIEVSNFEFPDKTTQTIALGDSYNAAVTLEIGSLDMNDLGVELVYAERENDKLNIKATYQFNAVSQADGKATYHVDVTPSLI